jgi:hypothetical protein
MLLVNVEGGRLSCCVLVLAWVMHLLVGPRMLMYCLTAHLFICTEIVLFVLCMAGSCVNSTSSVQCDDENSCRRDPHHARAKLTSILY